MIAGLRPLITLADEILRTTRYDFDFGRPIEDGALSRVAIRVVPLVNRHSAVGSTCERTSQVVG